MMFRLLYPFEYVESVFTIDYEKLAEMGYRGLIFDIDNTLVCHGADSNERVDALFLRLHSLGFQTLLLSNNREKRVKRFLRNIDSLYIANAMKPFRGGYNRAVKKMGLSKNEVVFIGDQIFTDTFGANRSGLPSILVRFIQSDGEVDFAARRKLEKAVLNRYFKSGRYRHRLGPIEIRK